MDQYFSPKVIDKYDSLKSEDEKRNFRDEVVNSQLRAIDVRFRTFEEDVAKEGVGISLGGDLLILGTSGAGAVAGAELAKTILAAISSGLAGSKAAIDKDVFYEKTMPALLAQMDALRKQQLVPIRTGLAQPTDKYSLYQALIDVDNYYIAGTIPGAISGITTESGGTTAKADQEIKEVIAASYMKDIDGEILHQFWKPDGKDIDKGNQKRLKDWMKTHGIDVSITLFLWGDKYSNSRKDAVRDLKLPHR